MSIFDRILQPLGYVSEKQFETKLTETVKVEIDKVTETLTAEKEHALQAYKAEIEKELPVWLAETAEAYRYEMPDPSIFANQADMYRISPILGTAIDMLGADVGTTKFNVKRMVGEETRDIPNHPFEILLRNPNPMDSGLEFAQYTASNYKLNGNAIWWLNRASYNDVPDEIWPVPFSMVQPITDKKMYIEHWDYFPGNGNTLRLETWEIVHFKTYNPNNRFIGLSPLESLAETIRGDLGMRKTNRISYVEHGGAPPSILAFKDQIQEPNWSKTKDDIKQAATRNEMMLLRGVGDGVTWLSRAMSNKDSEYIATLKQNLTDVFNRMCPGLVAMLSENATEANALAARATYGEKTLWPVLEVVAQKVTSDILPAYGRKLMGVYDDPRVVDKKLKMDEQDRFERSHTIEEVRREYYEDDPIGDDRDKLFIAQIKAESGDIQKPAPNPFTQQPSEDDEEQPPTEESPAEEDLVEDQSQDETVKAAFNSLNVWEKLALKYDGNLPESYRGKNIPTDLYEYINRRLPGCTDKAAIKALFERAHNRMVTTFGGRSSDALAVVKAIELAMRA